MGRCCSCRTGRISKPFIPTGSTTQNLRGAAQRQRPSSHLLFIELQLPSGSGRPFILQLNQPFLPFRGRSEGLLFLGQTWSTLRCFHNGYFNRIKDEFSGASFSQGLQLYVLEWKSEDGPDGQVDAAALVVMTREEGVLLALPLDVIPEEVLDAGRSMREDQMVGLFYRGYRAWNDASRWCTRPNWSNHFQFFWWIVTPPFWSI